MTTTSFDAAQTLPVSRASTQPSPPDVALTTRVRVALAFPALVTGLCVVGLGYLVAAWFSLSWVVGLLS